MRMPWRLGPAAVIPLLFLTACSPSPFDSSLTELAERDLDRLDDQERSLLIRVERGRAEEPWSTELPSVRAPEDYVRLALTRNPSIRAAEQCITHHVNGFRLRRVAEHGPSEPGPLRQAQDPTLLLSSVEGWSLPSIT